MVQLKKFVWLLQQPGSPATITRLLIWLSLSNYIFWISNWFFWCQYYFICLCHITLPWRPYYPASLLYIKLWILLLWIINTEIRFCCCHLDDFIGVILLAAAHSYKSLYLFHAPCILKMAALTMVIRNLKALSYYDSYLFLKFFRLGHNLLLYFSVLT